MVRKSRCFFEAPRPGGCAIPENRSFRRGSRIFDWDVVENAQKLIYTPNGFQTAAATNLSLRMRDRGIRMIGSNSSALAKGFSTSLSILVSALERRGAKAVEFYQDVSNL